MIGGHPDEPDPRLHRGVGSSHAPTPIGHEAVIERLSGVVDRTPVGLVLIGWEAPAEADGGRAGTDNAEASRAGTDNAEAGRAPVDGVWSAGAPGPVPHWVRVGQTVVFAVTACAKRTDLIIAATPRELAVVRPGLEAPAEAEGLAHRIAQRLEAELESLAAREGRPTTRWAIGVAASHRSDGPADLLRYAETALDDAWLLGGARLVAFDDGDRELLDRPDEPGP